MAARYRAGLTLRQIGAEVGRSHFTVLYHLRKLRGYRGMVTRILIARVLAAERAYSITRTRDDRRRLKHTLAMLLQKRPKIVARLIERSRPKVCSGCGRPITATALADLWAWQCGYCGDGRIVRRQGIGAMLNDRGPMARLRAIQGA